MEDADFDYLLVTKNIMPRETHLLNHPKAKQAMKKEMATKKQMEQTKKQMEEQARQQEKKIEELAV